MVDLNFGEFFYSQRPKELAEYRRLKRLQAAEAVVADEKEGAKKLLDEVKRKSPWRFNKRRRKRSKGKKKRRRLVSDD